MRKTKDVRFLSKVMDDSKKQNWNPHQYAKNARFVSDLGLPLIELLKPRPGERILDLGCGDGALTVKFRDLGCDVLGVDASHEMIAAARLLGLDASIIDGHALPFENEFDAVFSNAALHWMNDPDAVLKGVHRALKPGGRFAGEFGGIGNVATIVHAMEAELRKRDVEALNPWYFPSPAQYQARLESHSFSVSSIELIPRPTPLPGDLTGWLETFAQSFIAALPAAARPTFLADVIEILRPELCDPSGNWTADYVRLRFLATRS